MMFDEAWRAMWMGSIVRHVSTGHLFRIVAPNLQMKTDQQVEFFPCPVVTQTHLMGQWEIFETERAEKWTAEFLRLEYDRLIADNRILESANRSYAKELVEASSAKRNFDALQKGLADILDASRGKQP